MEKLIITAAICGAEVTKEHTDAIPYTIDEIVREAKAAYEAGAAIIHLHVREDDGTPTQNKNRFKLAIEAILKANSYDLGPKVGRIEDPAEWTEAKIIERAATLDTDKGPEGDFDD